LITRQTLLLYNFGLAIVFLMIGALSLLAYERLVDRPVIQPPFDPTSLKAIKEETDVDRLRNQAAFYFELGRDLKRARYADTDTGARDFRIVCFLVSGILAIGGAMVIIFTRPEVPKKATAPTA
jgi:hypothetical protein